MILTGIFVAFIVVGVILFAGFQGNNQSVIGSVVIWGTLDKSLMSEFFNELRNKNDSFKNVSYVQISEDNFDQQLAEALSSGKGPDVFILPQHSILRHEDKIITVPYDSYSLRDFKNKFIEEGELYLNNEGIVAFPLIIDPLVMYWNRDIFSNVGIAIPPKTWEEFFSLSHKITKKDDNLNIFRSAVSFGEFKNVAHAKEIISMLVMQTGNSITQRSGNRIDVSLDSESTEEAIDFFTQFSNPVKSVYTWNRSLPSSEKYFISGDLALYFGFASELEGLQKKNPNLNFDVTNVPQTTSGSGATFGSMYALAITKSSQNMASAFNVVKMMVDEDSLASLSDLSNLPPVSRNLLSKETNDPYLEIFNNSALLSKAWLDPNNSETNPIFSEMIESVISGRKTIKNAVQSANAEINELAN